MNALIGYSGFVGSYLIQSNMDFYNSTNIQTMKGKHYSRIYCSGLPAEKWKANQNPETDDKNITALIDVLETVSCDMFVLISTVDVYNTSYSQCEVPDICLNEYAVHPYGKNRRGFEVWCMQRFSNLFIFRLPALFGHGLKKNALYDMIHGNQIEKLRGHWKFQWYNLKWLSQDIEGHITKDHHIVNLVTPPIELKLIQTLFFPHHTLSYTPDSTVDYNIYSIYGHCREITDVLIDMSAYIRHVPRLMVSEIGWEPSDETVMLSYLKHLGICKREIVPSKKQWNMTSYSNVYSAQSILFGETIQIFQEQDRFLDILQSRLEKLRSVDTKIIIFGCPRQRIYSGEDAIGLFRKVGQLCTRYGITLCIENNSRVYGGNWLHTIYDTIEFVKRVDHPNIRANLDIGSMLVENETVVPDFHYIGHIQISFDKLGNWQDSNTLSKLLDQLKNYKGCISLEILNVTFHSIKQFVTAIDQL
jgi:hypothetical protein